MIISLRAGSRYYRAITTEFHSGAFMFSLPAFGEVHPDYPVRVINEREARAGAGILLVVALIAFSNAFLKGDFFLTRLVIVAFGFDFAIRVLVSPRFAPSLALGRFMVRNQTPEYVGAAQKRFAWSLGLIIAIGMGFWVLVLNAGGPVAMLGCLSCLTLLFFETAFGICVGCLVYQKLWPEEARYCPGNVCEIHERAPITEIRLVHLVPLVVLAGGIAALTPYISAYPQPSMFGPAGPAGSRDCTVPAFAKAIGHEAQWKLHNGC